ncbi:Purine-cytosine permease [Thermomonospora echinospora]|uniref:Purine-cytosine permease n=1 Tax=Thermomonospora echinospora TaxID=1992 RepID=A0A1H6DVY9_9ACTN|nr:Purine-cytosine permease [Thermomonospora echinospora]
MMSGRRTELSVSYTDDPRVVAEQRVEDYAQHAVPLTARVPRFKLLMANWSLLSAMVWLFYGALVSTLYGTRQAVIGLVLSVVVYSILNWFLTAWAIRTGLNPTLLSRRMFGTYGATLTALLIAASTTYYAVFESSVLAEAFHIHFGALDIRWWYLIVIVAVLPLMVGSIQTWMDRINGYLLPIYIVGIIAAVVVAAVQNDGGSDWASFAGVVPPQARPLPGWLMTFCVYMGIWLLMATSLEFSRMGRPQDLRFHQHVTFGWVYYGWMFLLNGLAGIYLVRTVLPSDPTAEVGVVQAIVQTLGLWGVLLTVVTQTRVNTLNYYLSSINWGRLAARLFGLRLPRAVWVVAVAAVAYLLMLTDVFSSLQKVLAWQGVFLVSWIGIVFTHFVLTPADRRNGPEFRPGRLRAVTPGLGVWVVASAVGIALTQSPQQFPRLSPLAPVVALAVSVLLYAVVLKLAPSSLLRREGDLSDEVDDPWAARLACHVCDRSYTAVEMDRDPAADGAPICAACGEVDTAFIQAVRTESASGAAIPAAES